MKRRIALSIAGAFLLLSAPLVCRLHVASGKPPSGESVKRFLPMLNYHGGRFHNNGSVDISFGPLDIFRVIIQYIQRPPRTRPERDIPSKKSDLSAGAGPASVVWFGHSSYLIRSEGYTVLVDPVLCGYAGPFPALMKAFRTSEEYHPGDLPTVDLLLVTHDHFDHLDRETVTALRQKVRRIVVPAGVGSHLAFWGFNPSAVTELGWHEAAAISGGVRVTALPAQHLSGRGPVRDRTLWASFVLRLHGRTFYIGGDGGYGRHFREAGEAHGPFDLALLECGRYNPRWSEAHLLPEEAVRAAVDLQARVIMPVHWAKFESRSHSWNEPVRRLLREADRLKVRVTVPMIGEAYPVGAPDRRDPWWETE